MHQRILMEELVARDRPTCPVCDKPITLKGSSAACAACGARLSLGLTRHAGLRRRWLVVLLTSIAGLGFGSLFLAITAWFFLIERSTGGNITRILTAATCVLAIHLPAVVFSIRRRGRGRIQRWSVPQVAIVTTLLVAGQLGALLYMVWR
ncbi:MAG: hypothetical protein AB8G96_12895 [Phycisphaerales bacterium]